MNVQLWYIHTILIKWSLAMKSELMIHVIIWMNAKSIISNEDRRNKWLQSLYIYMALCNCHIYSPSTFPWFYVKYTFPSHLKNSTHYHSTSLHQNISIICFWHNFLEVYRNYIFLKKVFYLYFPQKMWIPQGQGSSLFCILSIRQWLIHGTIPIPVE